MRQKLGLGLCLITIGSLSSPAYARRYWNRGAVHQLGSTIEGGAHRIIRFGRAHPMLVLGTTATAAALLSPELHVQTAAAFTGTLGHGLDVAQQFQSNHTFLAEFAQRVVDNLSALASALK